MQLLGTSWQAVPTCLHGLLLWALPGMVSLSDLAIMYRRSIVCGSKGSMSFVKKYRPL